MGGVLHTNPSTAVTGVGGPGRFVFGVVALRDSPNGSRCGQLLAGDPVLFWPAVLPAGLTFEFSTSEELDLSSHFVSKVPLCNFMAGTFLQPLLESCGGRNWEQDQSLNRGASALRNGTRPERQGWKIFQGLREQQPESNSERKGGRVGAEAI